MARVGEKDAGTRIICRLTSVGTCTFLCPGNFAGRNPPIFRHYHRREATPWNVYEGNGGGNVSHVLVYARFATHTQVTTLTPVTSSHALRAFLGIALQQHPRQFGISQGCPLSPALFPMLLTMPLSAASDMITCGGTTKLPRWSMN